MCLIMLSGCKSTDKGLERGLTLRSRLLSSKCSFDAMITADYGDLVHVFRMSCQADAEGTVFFSVTEPESISGITGQLSSSGGQLTFDDTALSFSMLADGDVSPVSSPWILINTLRSGYIAAYGVDGDYLRLSIDDSYEEDALRLDIWVSEEDVPARAEIQWQGRKIVSLTIENFTYM